MEKSGHCENLNKLGLTKIERRVTLNISRIFSLRMLGLFMILPILSLAAESIQGSTPFLIGLALGIYGLASAVMQVFMGALSDKIGRHKVISIGLILFILGSLIAAHAHSIEDIILGRLLQGVGAIGSTLLALLADHTREEVRFRAMGMMGMTIGLTFLVSLMVGPILAKWMGLSGIFYLMAVLGAIALGILWLRIPRNIPSVFHADQEFKLDLIALKKVYACFELWRLNLGVFIIHAILTGIFIIFPVLLSHRLNLPLQNQWKLYVPALILSFLLMFPFIIWSEKKRQMKKLMIGSVFLIFVINLGFYFFGDKNLGITGVLLTLFFAVFTLMEASLPSLVSKISPAYLKGTAMGVYSTCQFLGAFFGAVLGGLLAEKSEGGLVFLVAAGFSLFWWLWVLFMKQPPYLATRMIKLAPMYQTDLPKLKLALLAIPGVKEVGFENAEKSGITSSKIAYLKVDSALFEDEKILSYSLNF